MELSIPEISVILDELSELKKIVVQEKNTVNQYWFNDEQCWALKGGMALSTYRSNRFYQVKGGIPDAYVGGRKVWSKDSVMEWVSITDERLQQYHEKYHTGAKKR